MGEILKKAVSRNYAFWICLALSVMLILGGALTPPPFIIDSSIFIAVGELFAFAALGTLSLAIDKGMKAKVEHNGTKLTVGNDDDDDNDRAEMRPCPKADEYEQI